MDLGFEEFDEEEDGTDMGGRDKCSGDFFKESARADEWRSGRMGMKWTLFSYKRKNK
jgi:hypothetical protein